MKRMLVGSLLSLLAGANLAVAQSPDAGAPQAAMTPERPVVAAGYSGPGPAVGDMFRVDPVVPLSVGHGEPVESRWDHVVEPPGYCWGSVEYLLWWVRPGPISAPLVSTGSLADAFPGALGQPNTHVLFGPDNNLDYGATSGARFSLGWWFDRQGSVGIEGRGFLLEQRNTHNVFSSNGSGSPLIGTPFFNTALGREDWNDIAADLLFAGAVAVTSTTQLYGGEANIVANLLRSECWDIDVFGGFRFVGLTELLERSDATTGAPGNVVFFQNTAFPPPGITTTTDSFGTQNHFYGFNMGINAERKFGNAFVDVAARVAIGDMHESVNLTGSSSLFVGPVGPVASTGGGLLVLDNAGHRTDDTFAVVPEVEIKLGYQFNCHLSATVGYTFMYLSDVVRPGDQIDRFVNANRVPTFIEFNTPGGGAFPRAFFNTTDYWAHGVSFGIEYKF
jgi:hypothetical protein